VGTLVAITADLSLREASRVLRQPSSRLVALRDAGLVAWSDDSSPRLAQDALVTARKLSRVPRKKLARLAAVVVGLPCDIDVVVAGKRLTVRDSGGTFVVRSGQCLLNLGALRNESGVVPLRSAARGPTPDFDQLLSEALSLATSAPETARRLLLRIEAEAPLLQTAKLELAALDERLGSLAEAEERYRSILASAPDARAFAGLARALEGQNRFEDATKAYLSAVAIAPNDIEAHRRLAQLYRMASQPFLALKHQRLATANSRAR